MLDGLLDIVAPHSCCGCGYTGTILCQSCRNDIIFDDFSQCLVCLKPTAASGLCRSCRTGAVFDDGWSVGTRKLALKALLDRYKFSSAKRAGYVCAQLLDEQLPMLPDDLTVVAVPTTPAHRRQRGFDHTRLIAKEFARLRHLPYEPLLARRDNGTQHFKNRSERLRTAAQGLEVGDTVPEAVLLVDDIYTTGATLHACAQKLREHGVKRLFVAVVARQVLDEGDDLW